MKDLKLDTMTKPPLDAGFMPAVLWNRAYRRMVADSDDSQAIKICLERSNGSLSVFETNILPHSGRYVALNMRYMERMLKGLLWMRGACRVVIAGSKEIAVKLAELYSPAGERSFDYNIMSKIYGRPMEIVFAEYCDAPVENEIQVSLGGNQDGCRIGFDLGGSDRKCAALKDGEVVFTEEIGWDPYFQKDPNYHRLGIANSIERAAAHLPRVDCIGGSAAGVYVDNKVRVASLFRGVAEELFERDVVDIFTDIQREWKVPLVVVNDGEVTALAGGMSMGASGGVLGLSMGTSQAVGYVNMQGDITDWLNELAFAPVDYSEGAHADEWSGDAGCGVQYFSQQAVARLATKAGIVLPDDMPLPERLEEVQHLMEEGDERAEKIYQTIGVYLGYTVAHYCEFYAISNLLLLGRVTSGIGGATTISVARQLLKDEFADLASEIEFCMPDEQSKRHGQAVAAATLPSI